MTAVDQRSRILDAALGLMAEHGADGMSMRRLAAACELNVASLYHYFPSKSDLLREALAHRRFDALLAFPRPERVEGDVRTRLEAMLAQLFSGMFQDSEFWRAQIAEAMHGDEQVLSPLLDMVDAFEVALGDWLADLFPDAPALATPPAVRALRHAVIGVLIEHLPQPAARDRVLATRAEELADVFARFAAARPEPDPQEKPRP